VDEVIPRAISHDSGETDLPVLLEEEREKREKTGKRERRSCPPSLTAYHVDTLGGRGLLEEEGDRVCGSHGFLCARTSSLKEKRGEKKRFDRDKATENRSLRCRLRNEEGREKKKTFWGRGG